MTVGGGVGEGCEEVTPQWAGCLNVCAYLCVYACVCVCTPGAAAAPVSLTSDLWVPN